MARPVKEGLEYVSIDIDIFDDPKLMFVAERFEEKGELIAIKLLLFIYKNGYYTEWNDEVALLFANRKFKNVSFNLVNDVVGELLKRKFLNEDMYKRYGILTSKGIQKRWNEIVTNSKRKVKIDEKYNLLIEFLPKIQEETPAKREETPAITELTTPKREESTQSKVKESKVYIIINSEECDVSRLQEIFDVDIGLKMSWQQKGLPGEKFLYGVELFMTWHFKKTYPTLQETRNHFQSWMPNYHKAAAKAKKTENEQQFNNKTGKQSYKGQAGRAGLLDDLRQELGME